MLDYEVVRYKVEFHRIGACTDSVASFDTEDEAINYITDNQSRWDGFKLLQIRVAII